MRMLLLQRHAQAQSGATYARDHDRELSESGKRDAERVGRYLSRIHAEPGYLLASSATRTRETGQHLVRGLSTQLEIHTTKALYDARPQDVMEAIRDLPAGAGNALLIGHQPAWSEVVRRLTGAAVKMRTGAVACIQLEVRSWSQVRPRCGMLIWFLPPMAVVDVASSDAETPASSD